MKKAAFLDRDGVINFDAAYVHEPEEFQFLTGVFEACRLLQEADYDLVVVTNQSGIGRGYYSEADFAHCTEWMKERFKDAGVHIKAVYFCPHHPEKAQPQYLQTCQCRKPAPGMIFQARDDFGYDLSQSLIVGDKLSDMRAGKAAGLPTRILVGQNAESVPELQAPATHVAKNLLQAVENFLKG